MGFAQVAIKRQKEKKEENIMGLYSTFFKDSVNEKSIRGDFVFAPPFSLQDSEEHGTPYFEFPTYLFGLVILRLSGVDLSEEGWVDNEHGGCVETAKLLTIAEAFETWLALGLSELFFLDAIGEKKRCKRRMVADMARVFRRYGESGYYLTTG